MKRKNSERFDGMKFLKSVQGFMMRLDDDRVGVYAAQVAYFILLSFIPFLMLLLPLVRYTPVTEELVTDIILNVMPDAGELRNIILSIIQEVYNKSDAIVPISALMALWSAGKGMVALTKGVNTIYQVKETRSFLATRLRAMFYTLLMIIAVIMCLLILVFGNEIQQLIAKYVPFIETVTAYIIGMRTTISLVVLVFIFLMIYTYIPNRKASIKSQIPGAVISAIAWSVFSLVFSFYLSSFDSFSYMYGSLTTLIFIMLWLYFCMYILLIGAEINSYFEEKLRKVHRMASEKIKEEYYEFIHGLKEDLFDEDDDDLGSGEAHQAGR